MRRSSPRARRPGRGWTSCAPRSQSAADARRARAYDGRDAAVRRSGLHPARDRHGGHRHALVGRIGAGDELRAEPVGTRRPRAQRRGARPCRSTSPRPGQRVAVSLPGIERTQLRRGDALVEPGAYPLSYRLDVALEELEPIGDGARLHVHHGTAEIPRRRQTDRRAVRAAPPRRARRGRPRRPRRAARRERPSAAAACVDPAPPRHASVERLELLERGDVAATVHAPVRLATLATRLSARSLKDWSGPATGCSPTPGWWSIGAISSGSSTRADPLDPGVPPPAEPWAGDVIGPARAGATRREALPARGGRRAGPRAGRRGRAEARLGLEPVKVDDGALARYLEEQGTLVRVGDGYAVSRTAFDDARVVLVRGVQRGGQDHARALPRPARRRPADGAAAARAVRRRRRDPSRR